MRTMQVICPESDEMPDHRPVECGRAYVIDGELRNAPVGGTVADLKRAIGAREVRRLVVGEDAGRAAGGEG
jgi:hypothetical protein